MTTRRLATGLLAAVTAVSVSACGASLDAQTYQERNNAESTNAAAGSLALRNVAVEAPDDDEGYSVGDDATVILTVTNAAPKPDRLVEVTSSAAREVAVTGTAGRTLVVPALGSTDQQLRLELRGLTRPLRPGEYVDLTFRFASNGITELLAPVITTGETDRPVYTGERFEGGEEPALQAPAGGHHGEEHGEEEGKESGAVLGEGEQDEEADSEDDGH